MKKPCINWYRIDRVLSDFGMDKVSCELEFASAISGDQIYGGHLSGPQQPLSSGDNAIVSSEYGCNIFATSRMIPVSDASIRTMPHFRHNVEITLGPIYLNRMKFDLMQVTSLMKDIGLTNSSCGTHFHFNSSLLSYDELIKIHIAFFIFEPFLYFLSRNNRSNNRFCIPQYKAFFLEDIISCTKNSDYSFLIATVPNKDKSPYSKYGIANYCGVNSRYCGLNTYSHFFRNSIELRYFENRNAETNILFFNISKLIIYFALTTSRRELLSIITTRFYDIIKNNSMKCSPEKKHFLDYINLIFELLNIRSNSLIYNNTKVLISQKKNKKIEIFDKMTQDMLEFINSHLLRDQEFNELMQKEKTYEENSISMAISRLIRDNRMARCKKLAFLESYNCNFCPSLSAKLLYNLRISKSIYEATTGKHEEYQILLPSWYNENVYINNKISKSTVKGCFKNTIKLFAQYITSNDLNILNEYGEILI